MNDPRTLLKREESYAIHALVNIAEHPGTNAAQIAADLSLPAAFMSKVLRKLVEAGFIDSKTGRGGGVTLKVAPEQITILEVIEAVSGMLVLDTCQTQTRCATQRRRGSCRLKLAWIATSQVIRQALGGVRLSDLCQPEGVEA